MRPPAGRHVRVDPDPPGGRAGASAIALAVGAAVVVAALAWTWPAEQPPAAPLAAAPTGQPQPTRPTSPTPWTPTPAPTEASPTGTTTAKPVADRWRRVLASLDRRRAQAFRQDRPGLLRSVYSPGSAVLDQDRAMLAAYRARGLRVTDLRMRLLRLRVISTSPTRVVLHVVDRLDAGTAVAASGRRISLAGDRPSERRVVLAGAEHGWRIAVVRPG